MNLPLLALLLWAWTTTCVPVESLDNEDSVDRKVLQLADVLDTPETDITQRSLATESRDAQIEERDFGFDWTYCTQQKTYNVTKAYGPFQSLTRLAGAQKCEANAAGCSISDAKSYSVSVSILVGASFGLNLGKIATVGVNAQFFVSTSNAESVTTTINCPPNCTCGIQVTPTLYHIEGWQTIASVSPSGGRYSTCGKSIIQPYVVEFPVIDPKAAVNNQAIVLYTACKAQGSLCSADADLPECPNN